MTCGRRLIAALVWIAASQAAQADRSLDETDVVELGDCEVEVERWRQSARGAAKERESSIQLLCGIGWRTELATAFARSRSDGVRDEAIGIEAKTSLRDRAIGRVGWTLVYGVGAERSGGPWRRSGQFIAVEASLQPDEDWLIEASVGSARDRLARNDRTLWALAVERGITETVEVSAELAGDDRSRPVLSLALRYLVWPEHALVKLSYSRGAGPPRERRLGIGVTFEF